MGSYHDPAPCILRSPAHPAQVWTLFFSATCLTLWRSWIWNGLPQRNHPVAALMNGFCRSAARPLINEICHSSQMSTMRLPNPGVHPTRPAYVPLLPPSSLRSMAWKKNYMTDCIPLMSQWVRISARPWPFGWKAKAAHPSKPCRTTSALAGRAYSSAGQAASALHSMVVLQVLQAKLFRSTDESNLNPAAFNELCSATDLALRITKMTAQAIGRSMASLVLLERHLWLNLTEMKDADKVPFLDSPVSPDGLFGPAVEGFAERFIATQKSSQTMRHFLPKRSSSAAASSRLKLAPTQQPAKATPPAVQPAAKPEPRRSRSARRHPPKCQGPRPKIVLDHHLRRLPD